MQKKGYKINLALFDDIKSQEAKVSKMIGFINSDIAEVKKALQRIAMSKTDLSSTDNLANDLLKIIGNFETEAEKIGVDLPKEVVSATLTAKELLKTNDALRKLIASYTK